MLHQRTRYVISRSSYHYIYTEPPIDDKLLFINGFSKLINDAFQYARYIDFKKAEARALHRHQLQSPFAPQLHQVNQQGSSSQYIQSQNNHEYDQRLDTEQHTQPLAANHLFIASSVQNMSYEQYLARINNPHSVGQPHACPSVRTPFPNQHDQQRSPKNSPFSRKLNALLSCGTQSIISGYQVGPNNAQAPGETPTSADVERRLATELHDESACDAVQTRQNTPSKVVLSRNPTVYASPLYFFMKMVFPLMAAIAMCQEARVYMRCIFEKILEQLEWGLE